MNKTYHILPIKEVVDSLIQQIKDGSCGLFDKCGGYGIARQIKEKDGLRIVVIGSGSNTKSVSIEDNKCNYFYIRYRNDCKKEYKPKAKKSQRSACVTDYEAIIPLRLVAVVMGEPCTKLDPDVVEFCILSSIIGANLSRCSTQATIKIKDSCTDTCLVIEKEYGKDDISQFSNGLMAISIDFDLSIDLNVGLCQQAAPTICEQIKNACG